MSNYLLGGKDHQAGDRHACHTLLAEFPAYLHATRTSRLFMHRAVTWLARRAGIAQFLDLGCGLPLAPDVHQIAGRANPAARTVYADRDPVVVAYARALLACAPHTAAIAADITDPAQLLADPDLAGTLDLGQPVAALLLWVGHLLDDDPAAHVLAGLADAMPPGSYLVISHLTAADRATAEQVNHVAAGLGLGWRCRTRTQMRGLLRGLRPVHPGLLDLARWRPNPQQAPLPGVDDELLAYLSRTGQPAKPPLVAYGGVLRTTRTHGHPGRPNSRPPIDRD